MTDGRLGRRALLGGAGFLGAALAASGLAGCSDDDDALTFFCQATPDEAKVRTRIIDEFRKRHPDIPVRVLMSGPTPQQQLLTYCAGGKAPDVMMAWELYHAELAELGVLQDLNVMLAADPKHAALLRKESTPSLVDTFRYNSGLYALPEQWSGIFLYYNKRLFAEAGASPPPKRWSQAWSFAEFLAAAQATTKRDDSGRTTQWGFVDAWVPHYSASLFGMNNGVEWFSPPSRPTRSNIADDRFVEGFQFYADLAVRHKVAPEASNLQSATGYELFAQEKAAMMMIGHWVYSAFANNADLDFDVTVLPVGPRGHGSHSNIGTTGLAIAADSPRKKQAWEFVKFATGPVGQQLIAESGLFVPVLKSARLSRGFAESHRRIHNLEVFTEGPDNSRPLAVTPQWNRIDAVLRRGSDHILRGADSAAWFRRGTAEQIEEILNRRGM